MRPPRTPPCRGRRQRLGRGTAWRCPSGSSRRRPQLLPRGLRMSMNAQNPAPQQQPARRDGLPPRSDTSARRSGPLPRPLAPPMPAPGAPGQRPLVGKVHSPRSTAVVPRRRRGRWLPRGVPSVLAGVVGIGSFVTLGVSSLLGGAGLLAPLLAGLGIAAVVG